MPIGQAVAEKDMRHICVALGGDADAPCSCRVCTLTRCQVRKLPWKKQAGTVLQSPPVGCPCRPDAIRPPTLLFCPSPGSRSARSGRSPAEDGSGSLRYCPAAPEATGQVESLLSSISSCITSVRNPSIRASLLSALISRSRDSCTRPIPARKPLVRHAARARPSRAGKPFRPSETRVTFPMLTCCCAGDPRAPQVPLPSS